MGLVEQAKDDWAAITGNTDEFGIAMTFTAPTAETAEVVGLRTKIHLGVDTDCNLVNSRKAHISVSEQLLLAKDYPVRNIAGEVNLKGHKVTLKDSTGTVNTFAISQWMPDETMGVILCILADFEQ